MPLILGTNSIKDTGFDVANSCRFDDNAYMSQTWGSSGNRRTWTLSMWIKYSGLNNCRLFSIGDNASSNMLDFFFASGILRVQDTQVNETLEFRTTQLFRDPSAWSHLVFACDTTQGTEANRFKIYHNGTQITSFGTENYPSQNLDTLMNHTTGSATIGARAVSQSGSEFDGYMAEVVNIDGLQLDPTSFGEFDEDSGIWKPIDVSGLTFGTNGFYLDFEDSSALGNDVSGNNNDFTVNNLTAIDSVTDVPTNNFATMNPLDNFYASSTFSEGNLKLVQGSSTYAHNLSTIAVTNGKWYAEAKLTTDSEHALVGITDRSPVQALNDILGSNSFDYSIKKSNGDLFNNRGTNPSNDATDYAGAYAQNDIIGIALDLDNNKLYFSKGGQWSNGSGAWDSTTFNSSTGAITITAPASTNNGHYFFASGDYGGAVVNWEWNFGSPPYSISSGNSDGNGYGNFEYAVPSGYYALNTKNLAEYG